MCKNLMIINGHAVILLQIVMVCPGTHLVKNHESLSKSMSPTQLKKKTRISKLKILGMHGPLSNYVTRQLS